MEKSRDRACGPKSKGSDPEGAGSLACVRRQRKSWKEMKSGEKGAARSQSGSPRPLTDLILQTVLVRQVGETAQLTVTEQCMDSLWHPALSLYSCDRWP